MHILFISRDGDSVGLAHRCVQEGFKASVVIEGAYRHGQGSRLCDVSVSELPMTNNQGNVCGKVLDQILHSHKDVDFIWVDGYCMGKVTDYLREKGLCVVGSTGWTDTLFRDRKYTSLIFGLPIVPSTPREVRVGGWWNGTQLVHTFCMLNNHRIMTDNVGGAADSTLYSLFKLGVHPLFEPIVRIMKKQSFRGLFTIGVLDNMGVFSLTDFSAASYPIPGFIELYKGNITELISAVALGRTPQLGELTEDTASASLVSISPFPYQIPSNSPIIIHGVQPSNMKHVYPLGMGQDQEDRWITCAGWGKTMWVTARGQYLQEAQRRLKRTLSSIYFDDMQYRSDLC